MGVTDCVRLAAFLQLLGGVGPDGLEHVKPTLARRGFASDQAAVQQPGVHVQGLGIVHLPDRGGPSQRPAPREDGEPAEQHLLGGRQQVVAPRDGPPQRLMPLGDVPRASGKDREGLVEPGEQGRRG
jgi:hypothetical protein